MESALSLTRSILVVLVPGTVVVAPWLLWTIQHRPDLGNVYLQFPLAFNAMAFAVVAVFGTLMEGIAAYVEKRWDDAVSAESDKPDPEASWLYNDWYSYLSKCFEDREPVGYRYLSRKATEMHFCMAMMMAAPAAILGIGALLSLAGWNGAACASLPAAAFASALFWKFATDTHCVLYVTRHEIMKRLNPRSCD